MHKTITKTDEISILYNPDCSKAKKTANGVAYVGKYCEIPFEKSCSVDDDELFCVNGADCNPDYE